MELTTILDEVGLLSLDDVKRIKAACDGRINTATANMKYVLKPGDVVIVSGGRKLDNETGRVTKVNITRAVVKINGEEWRVPFGMIKLHPNQEVVVDV